MAPSLGNGQNGHTNNEQESSRKRPYRVVHESITRKKKKLRSGLSTEIESPWGYTFVPVGAPDLTQRCKELSRQRDQKLFIVSVGQKKNVAANPNILSHHLHRVGHHFENGIVEEAGHMLGYFQSDRTGHGHAKYVSKQPHAMARRLDAYGKKLQAQQPQQHESADPEKRAVAGLIRDLFPKMPASDQEAIVTRAFAKGSGNVGEAQHISLPRRVQLAVSAHIRHNKTDYDQFLKETSWSHARDKVARACLDQILEWRGEDGAASNMDDVYDEIREVIIIDDDDDDDDEEAQSNEARRLVNEASNASRDSSIEIISTQAIAADLTDHSSLLDSDSPDVFATSAHVPSELEIVHVQPKRNLQQAPVLNRQGVADVQGNSTAGARAPPTELAHPQDPDLHALQTLEVELMQANKRNLSNALIRTNEPQSIVPSVEPSSTTPSRYQTNHHRQRNIHAVPHQKTAQAAPWLQVAAHNRPFFVPRNLEAPQNLEQIADGHRSLRLQHEYGSNNLTTLTENNRGRFHSAIRDDGRYKYERSSYLPSLIQRRDPFWAGGYHNQAENREGVIDLTGDDDDHSHQHQRADHHARRRYAHTQGQANSNAAYVAAKPTSIDFSGSEHIDQDALGRYTSTARPLTTRINGDEFYLLPVTSPP